MVSKLVLVIYKNRKHLTNDGKEMQDKMYFLELVNGNRVPIKPVFKNDYSLLNVIAEVEYNESEKKDGKK